MKDLMRLDYFANVRNISKTTEAKGVSVGTDSDLRVFTECKTLN